MSGMEMEMEIRDVLANSLGIRTDALHAFQRVKNHLQVPERVQGRAFAQTAAEINKRNCQSCMGKQSLDLGNATRTFAVAVPRSPRSCWRTRSGGSGR